MLSGPTLRLIAMGYGVQFSRLSDGYHISHGTAFSSLVQFSFNEEKFTPDAWCLGWTWRAWLPTVIGGSGSLRVYPARATRACKESYIVYQPAGYTPIHPHTPLQMHAVKAVKAVTCTNQ